MESKHDLSVHGETRQTQYQREKYQKLYLDWKKKGFIEFYLQLKSLYECRKHHNMLTFPIIVLSTVAGASIFTSNNEVIQYIAASFSLASGLLTGLVRQFRPGEKATEHLAATRRWSKLLQQIQINLLNLDNEMTFDVKNSEIELTKIQSEMEAIISSQPEPSQSAVSKIKHKYGTDNVEKIWFGSGIEDLIQAALDAEREKGLFRHLEFLKLRRETRNLDEDIKSQVIIQSDTGDQNITM